MGGRGAFINVENKDFRFVDNGQTFITIGEIDDIQIISRMKPYQSKAPEYSHTKSRIYAVVKNGIIKNIVYYDSDHKQQRCVDFTHKHGKNRVMPHVHFYLEHNDFEDGVPASSEDLLNYEKVKRWLNR